MSIYTGSRYKETKVYTRESAGVITFNFRKKYVFDPKNCRPVAITEGMTLDVLAYELYGDPQFDWIIRDVNRTKDFSFGLVPGDIILCPTYAEVAKVYG